jgi:HEAT repeat protein
MMRLAALKSLKALSIKDNFHVYIKTLKDSSLIVRMQALENISHLKMKPMAPHVWKMLYDQSNYAGDNGKRKRINIVKNVIRTLGDLEYKKALKPLTRLIVKNKYHDLEPSINYSLEQISGLNAPNDVKAMRKFWARQNFDSVKKI